VEIEEICVTTENPSDDTATPRIWSPIKAGVTLLCIYIAMYLAIAGVVHVLTSPDAAPVAPDSSMAHTSAATASTSQASASESPRSDRLDQVAQPTDSSRERRSSAAIESNCMCD
jgi:hypothetical protein